MNIYILRETFIFISIGLLMTACNPDHQNSSQEDISLFLKAKSFPLNTIKGYFINPYTGDSIQQLMVNYGDTVVTGTPIEIVGEVVLLNDSNKPTRSKAGLPQVKSLTLNINRIPDNLTIINVDEATLKSHADIDTYLDNFVEIRSKRIQTGVPLPAFGNKKPTKQPKPSTALPSAFMDNAIYNIQYLDVEQGIASSYVRTMLEDQFGNIWFGTWGGGVSKYNGTAFTTFTQTEGLTNNYVLSILEDKDKNIWIGTEKGVSKYDGTSFTNFTHKEGMINDHITSIMEDRHGNIWFGSFGGGAIKYDGETFTHFTENEGLSNNKIHAILEDSHGDIWFGTDGGGASKFDGKAFVHFTEKEGLTSNYIWSIHEDKNGNMWFGAWEGGLTKYDGSSFTHYTDKEGLNNNNVTSILEDRLGNLWFGTWGGGVSKYDPTELSRTGSEHFINYTQNEGLSSNNIKSLLEDHYGNIWFGTWGRGVNKYRQSSFVHYKKEQGLSSNLVFFMLKGSNENIWFGTNNGVSKYDGETFANFTKREGLSNNSVWSILEDRKGHLWFGTEGGGVNKFDGEYFTYFSTKNGLCGDIVHSILEDQDGSIWFGTWGGGVSKYDGESFTNFTQEGGGLLSNNVTSLLEDEHGNIWIGTEGGGVSKYTPALKSNTATASITHITEKEGLINNNVVSILEDDEGSLWFGTYNGLNKYDGKSFTYFTKNEGLSNNHILSLLMDQDKNMWISTQKGINMLFKIKRGQEVQSDGLYKVVSYGKRDGLKSMDFFNNSVILDNNNKIWWGGGISLTMLDLEDQSVVEQPSIVQLDYLEVNEKFVNSEMLDDETGNRIEYLKIHPFSNYPIGLKLSHDQNYITFHYNAINWSGPHKNYYRYMVEGLNNTWSIPTPNTKVDFRNLPHGSYTFKVQAMDMNEETWSKPFNYVFTIYPPWWLTWWAKLIWMGSILGAAYAIYYARVKSLKRQQESLHKQIAQRTRELRESNDELLFKNQELKVYDQMVSHDLRGPMGQVNACANLLKQDLDSSISTEGHKILDFILKSSNNAIKLIDGILTFASAEQPASLEQEIDLNKLMLDVIEGHSLNIKTKEATVKIDTLPIIKNGVSVKVYQLFYNLVGNALKFQKPDALPVISIYMQGKSEVVVEDNGVGFDQQYAKEIFQPLKRVHAGFDGFGIGLGTCKRIADFHGWDIQAESEVGKGSKFIITL